MVDNTNMKLQYSSRLKGDDITIEEQIAIRPEDLREMLGQNWAICRPTERNKERYTNCVTRRQYLAAEIAILKRKGLR